MLECLWVKLMVQVILKRVARRCDGQRSELCLGETQQLWRRVLDATTATVIVVTIAVAVHVEEGEGRKGADLSAALFRALRATTNLPLFPALIHSR